MILGKPYKNYFLLDESITYFNFGAFGAAAKPVFEEYQRWQLELEKEPTQFFTANHNKYLEQSRKALAEFINCDADDVVYVMNPSYAVNIIAKSFNLQKGDEVLATNLEYGACDKTWEYYCEKEGAVYRKQPITLPLTTKEKFIEELFQGFNGKTKLIFISHITSATALIFPVKDVIKKAKELGVPVFIDGAHVPGHISLDLKDLQPDFYTGACHKWMMTPKGSTFLYIKRELQNQFDPLIVSWGYKSAMPSHSLFLDYHQLQGTRDISAFLTIPAAIEFMKVHNWTEVAKQCRKLVQDNAQRFCDLLNTQPLAPVNDEFIGQMLSIPIQTNNAVKLYRFLFDEHKIEIPVMNINNKFYLRYSINAFNSQEDLDKLFGALREAFYAKLIG